MRIENLLRLVATSFLTLLLSSPVFARLAYTPNVFECESNTTLVTYSLAAWHGQPIFVVKDFGSTKDKLKRMGWSQIMSIESSMGTEVKVLEENHSSEGKTFLSMLIPRLRLDGMHDVHSFESVLVRTYEEKGTNIYTPVQCRARLHIE